MATKTTVVGFVQTHAEAAHAVDALHRAGFPTNEISALFPHPHPSAPHGFDLLGDTKAPEGAVAGVGAGGLVGGAIGLLVGIGALTIPGLGPFIAAGPLMIALSAATAGAVVGGVSGSLIGMGITEPDAAAYEEKLREGHILVSVHVHTDDARIRAEKILHQLGVHEVASHDEPAS